MRTEPRMRLVYIAGKFSAPNREGVERNIREAEAVGIQVATHGAFPVVPHSNTSHPDYERVQAYPFWIKGTLELLRRCDCVVMVAGWQESSGATGEREEARRIGIPVFDSLEEFLLVTSRDSETPTIPDLEKPIQDEGERLIGASRGVDP